MQVLEDHNDGRAAPHELAHERRGDVVRMSGGVDQPLELTEPLLRDILQKGRAGVA